MNTKLLEESVGIFNCPEKWNALFEIYEQSDQIMNHWLAIGARALVADFNGHPSPGWVCRKWDQNYEVRWHLEAFGEKSIGIGFGWPTWEYHLFVRGGRQGKAESRCRTSEGAGISITYQDIWAARQRAPPHRGRQPCM